MDVNEFNEMCKKTSALDEGVFGIKKNVPDALKVIYDNKIYYPLFTAVKYEKGKRYFIGFLHDLKANSVTQADLDKVFCLT